MDSSVPIASLSLTHVHYNPTDPVSYFCAWLALLPQGLCVVYATLIWSTREAEIVLMFLGQLACEALNFMLKRLIKEERPVLMHGKGYGMPSSHAQFVAFFAVALTLFLLFRHQPKPSSTYTPLSLAVRAALCLALHVVAGLVAWSRIYLNYHTPKQVAVGCAAGVVSGWLWFGATTVIRRSGLLSWALDTTMAKLLRARDLVVEEDLCQAGWEKWEGRRAAGQTAKAKRN